MSLSNQQLTLHVNNLQEAVVELNDKIKGAVDRDTLSQLNALFEVQVSELQSRLTSIETALEMIISQNNG